MDKTFEKGLDLIKTTMCWNTLLSYFVCKIYLQHCIKRVTVLGTVHLLQVLPTQLTVYYKSQGIESCPS
jgi:hypothetical protein